MSGVLIFFILFFLSQPTGKVLLAGLVSHQGNPLQPRVFVVAQLLSCVRFCNPMVSSTPSFPVLHHLQEFAQTHVH